MTKDGGLAFPVTHTIDGNWVRDPRPEYSGMTLRDYFAGQALMGACANSGPTSSNVTPQNAATILAAAAYVLADAMLAEREKCDG